MLDQAEVVVTNTTPLISLVAAGDLSGLYGRNTWARRLARLSNLNVTGSIGILLKAKSLGYPISMSDAINRMNERGIWLSRDVVAFALAN